MPIKVLHVIDNLRHGGAQVSLKTLLGNLDPSKIECTVCVLSARQQEISIDTPLVRLNYRRWDPRVVRRLVKVCREAKVDIVHAHLQKSIIASLLANISRERPLVIHMHGGVFLKELDYLLFQVLLKYLGNKATIVLANSASTAQKLVNKIKIKSEKIRIVYNPIDFESFYPRPDSRKKIRTSLGIQTHEIVLGFVGRLHKMKGVDLLIKAMPMLLQKDRSYCLLVAGDGPELPRLEALVGRLRIADRVRFFRRRDDIPEIMSTFDIGVIPSRHEPFGRVAVELMRTKVPIVTSGVDGLGELVNSEQTGLVTAKNTAEEICRAVERLVADQPLRERIAEAAYAFSEQFGTKAYLEKIQKVYNELLNGPQSQPCRSRLGDRNRT